MLNQTGFYEELLRKTNLLTKPLKEYLEKKQINACIQQIDSMFTLFFGLKKVRHFEDTKHLDNETFARFFRFLFSKGVYIPPLHIEAWFVSMSHKEDHLIKTRDLVMEFLDREI